MNKCVPFVLIKKKRRRNSENVINAEKCLWKWHNIFMYKFCVCLTWHYDVLICILRLIFSRAFFKIPRIPPLILFPFVGGIGISYLPIMSITVAVSTIASSASSGTRVSLLFCRFNISKEFKFSKAIMGNVLMLEKCHFDFWFTKWYEQRMMNLLVFLQVQKRDWIAKTVKSVFSNVWYVVGFEVQMS